FYHVVVGDNAAVSIYDDPRAARFTGEALAGVESVDDGYDRGRELFDYHDGGFFLGGDLPAPIAGLAGRGGRADNHVCALTRRGLRRERRGGSSASGARKVG